VLRNFWKRTALGRVLLAILCICVWIVANARDVADTIAELEVKLEAAEDDQTRVDVLNKLAWHNIFGHPEKCKPYLDQSIDLAKSIGYVRGEAYAYDIWGNIFRVTGLYEEAAKYHLRSLKMNESIDYTMGLGFNYGNLGMVFFEQGEFEEALKYYQQAVEIKETIDEDPTGLFLTYGDIVKVLISLRRYDEALEFNEKIADYRRSRGESHELGVTYFNAADIYARLGETEKAFEYLELGEQKLAISSNHWVEIEISLLKAKLCLEQNKTEAALRYAENGHRLAEQYYMAEFGKRSFGLLAEIYLQKGDYRSAYLYLQKKNEILEQSFVANPRAKTALLRAEFELDRKQAQIQSKYRTRMLVGVVVLLGLIILLSFAIATILIVRRKNAKLALAKQQIENRNTLIESQKEDLAESNAAKDKVFSIISHDLKSPLTSLNLLLEMFDADDLEVAEFKRHAKTLSQRVTSINDTLSQLLVWAQSQQNGINSNPRQVKIMHVVEQKVELYDLTAKQKKVALQIAVDDEHAVWADSDQLHLIMNNLIHNALKFTAEGGKVIISSELLEDENAMLISVEDSGIGMNQKEIETLFMLSKRRTKPGTKGERGTGLGLKICIDMIELNGGRLEVESEPGEGSIFKFTLPTKQPKVEKV
jgi:two-component system sensor histidine kinase/response regulator